jgi:hypothetical protein
MLVEFPCKLERKLRINIAFGGPYMDGCEDLALLAAIFLLFAWLTLQH